MTKDHVRLWEIAKIAAPAGTFFLMFFLAARLGNLAEGRWVGQAITGFQGFLMLGCMMFPLAAYALAQRCWYQARVRFSQTWPAAEGHIVSSRLEVRRNRSRTFHKLAVVYRYAVQGVSYERQTVGIGPVWQSDQDLMTTMAERYPPGATVSVHYDPGDPGDAVLDTSNVMARQGIPFILYMVIMPFVLSAVVLFKNGR